MDKGDFFVKTEFPKGLILGESMSTSLPPKVHKVMEVPNS